MSYMDSNDLQFQDRYESSQGQIAEYIQDNMPFPQQQQQQQQQPLNQLGQQYNKQLDADDEVQGIQEQIDLSSNQNEFQGNVEVDQNYQPTEDQILDYAKYLGFELPQDQNLLWIARQGLKAPLPQPWRPCRNIDGDIYFFNFQNGTSIWEHPSDEYYRQLFMEKKAELQGLAEGLAYRGEDDDDDDDDNGPELADQNKELDAIQDEKLHIAVDHNKKQQNQVVGVDKLPKQEEARLEDQMIQNSAHFADYNQDSSNQNTPDNNNEQQDQMVVGLQQDEDQANHHAHEFTLAQKGEFSQQFSEQNIQQQQQHQQLQLQQQEQKQEKMLFQSQKKSFQFDFDQQPASDKFLHGSQKKKEKKNQPKHQERRGGQNQDVSDRIFFAQQQLQQEDKEFQEAKPRLNQSLDFAQAIDDMPTNNQNRSIDSPKNFALDLPHQEQQHLAQFGQNIEQQQVTEQELKPFHAPRFVHGPPDSQNQYRQQSADIQQQQQQQQQQQLQIDAQDEIDDDDDDQDKYEQEGYYDGQNIDEDDEDGQLLLLMEQCPQQIRDAIHMYQSSKHLQFNNFYHGLLNGMADRAQIPSVQDMVYDLPRNSQQNTERNEKSSQDDPFNQNEEQKQLKQELNHIQLEFEKKEIELQQILCKQRQNRSQQMRDKYQNKVIQSQNRLEQKQQNQRLEIKDQLVNQHELQLQAINVKLKGMIDVEKLKIQADANVLENNSGAAGEGGKNPQESRLLSHRGVVFSKNEREKEKMREEMTCKVKQWKNRNLKMKDQQQKRQIELTLEQNYMRDLEKFKRSIGIVEEGRRQEFKKIKDQIQRNYLRQMESIEKNVNIYEGEILQKKLQLEYEGQERELQKGNLDLLKHGRQEIQSFRLKQENRIRNQKSNINGDIKEQALSGDLGLSKKSGNIVEIAKKLISEVKSQNLDLNQKIMFIEKQSDKARVSIDLNQKYLSSLQNIRNTQGVQQHARIPSSSLSRIYGRQKVPQQYVSSSSQIPPILHQGDESSSFIILNSQQGHAGRHFLPHLSSGQSSSLAQQRNIFSRHGMQNQPSPKIKRSQESQQYIRSTNNRVKSYQKHNLHPHHPPPQYASNQNNIRQSSQCQIGEYFEQQEPTNTAEYFIRNNQVKSVASHNRGSRITHYQDMAYKGQKLHQQHQQQQQAQARLSSISAIQPPTSVQSQNNSMINMQQQRINQLEGQVNTLKDLILISNQNQTLNSDISYQQANAFNLQQQQQQQILPTFGNRPNTIFSNYVRAAPGHSLHYSKSNNELVNTSSNPIQQNQLNNSTIILDQLREEKRQFLLAIDEMEVQLSVYNKIKATTEEGRDNWEREKKQNQELPVTNSSVSLQMTRDYNLQLANTNKSIQTLNNKIMEFKKAVDLVKQIQKKVKLMKDSRPTNDDELKNLQMQYEEFTRYKIEKKIGIDSFNELSNNSLLQQQLQGNITIDNSSGIYQQQQRQQQQNTISTIGNNSSQLLAQNRKKILNDQLSILAYNQRFYQIYQRNLISMNRNRENLKAMLNRQMSWISSMKDQVNRTSNTLLSSNTSRFSTNKQNRLYM